LKDTELASLLHDFKIHSNTIWPKNRKPDSKGAKGYRRFQFEMAWRAYRDDGTASQTSNVRSSRAAGDGTV
jgi:hypothetical protein